MSTHTLLLSHVQLFAIPWIVALQAPLSVEFFRKNNWTGEKKREYWSRLPLVTPGDLPHPVISLPQWSSCLSCISRWILYPSCHLGSPQNFINISIKEKKKHHLSLVASSCFPPKPILLSHLSGSLWLDFHLEKLAFSSSRENVFTSQWWEKLHG